MQDGTKTLPRPKEDDQSVRFISESNTFCHKLRITTCRTDLSGRSVKSD